MDKAVRLYRVFHWVGIVLATPVLLVALVAFYEWLRGGFPSTVTVTAATALLVLLMLLAGAGLVYGASRAIGWIVLTVSGTRR